MISKYGMEFKDDWSPLNIEVWCIQRLFEKKWQSPLPLWEHYRNAFSLLWPEDDHHRWSELGLKRIVENEITILLGPADSAKTDTMSKFVIADWWIFPEITIWLVSSTELRGAELRIWGKIKQLFNRARTRHPWLPGSVLESYHCITTDTISEDQSEGRLMNKGIMFIPCKRGGQWIGMGSMVGVKPPPGGRMGHAGDEIQAMQRVFLDAYSNWYGKANFKGIMAANPATTDDPAGIASEPLEGWQAWQDNGKTQEWTSKFYDAHVVNFDGRDTPNNDYDGPFAKFSYLVGRKKMEAVKKMYGEFDWHWWNQCVGKMRPGADANRIIPIQLCEECGAFNEVVWKGGSITDIVGLDAAYGGIGGDRCVLMHIKYGLDVDGIMVIACFPPVIVPVSVLNARVKPEDQIAIFAKDYCFGRNIPASNFFFDGRGTLGVSLSRLFDPMVNAVEFGGPATDRPISQDIFIWDGDEKTKRLKKCNEEYSKFVTELWFTVRLIIQCKQMRGLPREVADEGSKRQWKEVKGPRMEAETKADMKERTQWSPDLMDALCFCENTLVLTDNGNIPIQHIQHGDMICTPFGSSPVVCTHVSIPRQLCRVGLSDGTVLIGTPEHKVYVKRVGWVRMDGLSIDNEVESVHSLWIWNILNALFTKDKRTFFKALVDIIKTEGTMRRRDFFIESSGLSGMDLFLKACASITRMVIGRMIHQPITNLCRMANTWLITVLNAGRTRFIESVASPILSTMPLLPRQNGMDRKLENNGTGITAKRHGSTKTKRSIVCALFAAFSSRRSFQRQSSAQSPVAARTSTVGIRMQCLRGVLSVVNNLKHIAIAAQGIVPITVRPLPQPELKKVYNLTLLDHNVYYANGILVQNCIACEGARRRGFQIAKLKDVDEDSESGTKWLADAAKENRKLWASKQLSRR